MTARNEIARIARRVRVRYEENRREVIGSSLFTVAIVLAALSYALATGTSILMAFIIALTWFVIGAVTIGMLMVTDVPRRPRRRRLSMTDPVTHSHYHGHSPYGKNRGGQFAHEHEHTHPDGSDDSHQTSDHEHERNKPDGAVVWPKMSDPADRTGS